MDQQSVEYSMQNYDIIVIGGGRAANLAIAAAKAGQKTALIEKDRLGGTCPNRGCVPSKLLIGYAEAARRVSEAHRFFIDASLNSIDTEEVFNAVNGWIDGVDERYEERVIGAGVDLFRGEASFSGKKIVTVRGKTLTAETIVIGTGSRPRTPPYDDLPVWTSDNLFPMEGAPPKSLLIIGGGFIGCEMAAFFSAIGTRVRLFSRSDRLLTHEDPDIEEIFQEEFEKEVPTECHAVLEDLNYHNGTFEAKFLIHGEEHSFSAERVLFAIGRTPNSESLNLDTTGLSADNRGFIPVDDCLETEIPGIYAIGDINGRFMLQHAAAYEVHYLRQRLLKGAKGPIDESLIGHAVFSHPEVASVGLTEEQAREKNLPHVTVMEDWLASARAMASGAEYPRTKLVVSTEDYSILGCHLVGPESSTLLHQVLMLMRLKNDVRELANMIYVHPALNECLLAAGVKAVGAVRRARA